MTVVELDQFKSQLLTYFSNMCYTMAQKIELGTNWKNDLFILYRLSKYIEIIFEHTLQTEADYDIENINFLNNEQMLDIQTSINEIVLADYRYDFFLT